MQWEGQKCVCVCMCAVCIQGREVQGRDSVTVAEAHGSCLSVFSTKPAVNSGTTRELNLPGSHDL